MHSLVKQTKDGGGGGGGGSTNRIGNYCRSRTNLDRESEREKAELFKDINSRDSISRERFNIGLRRKLSLQEALELAYAEDDVDITAIYTERPEISVLSDEDYCAEDDDGDINRLSGRQLRAAVEIQQRNNVRINNTQKPFVKEKQTNFVWASGDLQSKGKNFIPPDFSDFADSTPVEVFEMLWDDDIMKLLVDETRKYALFKNAPDPNITYEEIKCAVAILILSGYDVKPARIYYWDSKSDMGNQLFFAYRRKAIEAITPHPIGKL
ncbi:hypothetical protein NQ318_021561 [Aromia moschata]|uniref:PiggyBac transposable element-derived protein domain-containing protein n=1 Tax=Aromia moschata TaxID=1265417 RepID=A0AAV8YKP3_9CUCU|nr:hypothetical protein NQ318_021561 [Aromia moschata]